MKTTVELPGTLLREAQQTARSEHTTLKALIEAGLRTEISRRKRAGAFVLRDASVSGHGRQPEFQDASWEKVRAAI